MVMYLSNIQLAWLYFDPPPAANEEREGGGASLSFDPSLAANEEREGAGLRQEAGSVAPPRRSHSASPLRTL